MKRFALSLVLIGAVSLLTVHASELDSLNTDIGTLFSKLQSMGHGYYTQVEWDGITQQMDALAMRAEAAQAWDQLVEMNRVKAMVLGQMLQNPKGAIEVLQVTLGKYGQRCPNKMGRVYAMLADNYAQLGDDAKISTLIKDFEQSPYYTVEQYSYSGGQGRDVPLTVTRPVAKGSASIIVTMMERARRKATFGPGKTLPADASCTDLQGRTIKLADLRGKVVLVDLFVRGSALYPQLLRPMANAYQQHQKNGFEIVSINTEVGAHAGDVAAFANSHGMTWVVALDQAQLAHKLAVFGDAANFLLDRNGVIVTRDIHEADLLQSVKDALGVR